MPREIHKEQKEIERQILHMDGDAFFVGVEIAKNPKLRGLPVVTGEERGIVSALSYEAKALGIKRGMPIFKLIPSGLSHPEKSAKHSSILYSSTQSAYLLTTSNIFSEYSS
jgi:nucleotidyltransferase/DNA polymerase involved in DNA repair